MLSDLGRGRSNLSLIEERTVTVRGEDVTASIREGVGDDGEQFRSLDVAFQGKNGPALLVMSFPAIYWDEAVVQQVLDSLR